MLIEKVKYREKNNLLRNMTVLIINNYVEKKDFWRAQKIGDILNGWGYKYQIIHFSKIQKIDPNKFDAIILSGSSYNLSLEPPEPFREEMNLITNSKVPVLGLCFGHQLVAKAFGSQIKTGKLIQGFRPVRIVKNDRIFNHCSSKIYLRQNHQCYVENISDEQVLATSDTCKIEAIKIGLAYGFQAHLERADDKHPDGLKILCAFLSFKSL